MNKSRFGLQNVEIIESNSFDKIQDRMFDIIITNPPIRAGKKVIYGMFEDSYKHLNPNGKLYIVIRKDQGANTASKFIESVFGNITLLGRDKGYYVFEAIKQEFKLENTENKEDLQ